MLRPQSAPLWHALLGSRETLLFAILFLLVAIPQTILLTVVPLQAHALLEDAGPVSILYFAIGVFGLASRLTIPLLTHLFRRRWVFTLGAACLVLAAALYAARSVPALVLALGFTVFAYACLEITLNLYVLDHVSRRQLGRFEPIRIFVAAGPWTIGPWLGVYLQERVAWWLPFAVASGAAILLAAAFWLLRLAERSPPNARRTAPNPLRYLPRFFAQPRLRLAWALAAGRSGWWGMFFIYAPILAVTSGLGEEAGGAIVSIGTGWIWLVPVWGLVAQRFGARGLMMTGFLTAGLLSLAAAWAVGGQGWLAPLLLLAAGLGTGTLDGVGNLLFLRAVHPYERAEMTTVFVSYRDVAQLAPPGFFSVLLFFLPLSSVFAASGLAMLALGALTRYIPRRF
jgi:MFS transporter, ACDE family, multidrug resistance protein